MIKDSSLITILTMGIMLPVNNTVSKDNMM